MYCLFAVPAERHELCVLKLFPLGGLELFLRDKLLGMEGNSEAGFVHFGALLWQEIKNAAIGAVIRAEPNAVRAFNLVERTGQRKWPGGIHRYF